MQELYIKYVVDSQISHRDKKEIFKNLLVPNRKG